MEIICTSRVNVVAKAKRYGRWWLLKGLCQEVAGDTTYQIRLRKELDILTQMQHPGVVAVSGLEQVDGLGECIVMEYVDGTTLTEWLRGDPPRASRRNMAWQLAEVVGYVHSKGIVHRDIKPENIIVTRNGQSVKLIDFGLADTASYAVLKQPAGTDGYMSPEQKETAVPDVRNDIYSLGVIFRQMRLGAAYRNIARKCLLPIERRYQTIAELQRAMKKAMKLRSASLVFFALLLSVALIALVLRPLLSLEGGGDAPRRGATEGSQQQKRQDTIASTYQAKDGSTVRAVAPAIQQEVNSLPDRSRQVKEAIDCGTKEITQAMRATGVEQHLDTLSSIAYFRTDVWSRIFEPEEMYKNYLTGLNGQFTDAEMAEIERALERCYDKWVSRMVEKCKEIQR